MRAIRTVALAAALGLSGCAALGQKAAAPKGTVADTIALSVLDGLWLGVDMHWHKGEYCHIVNLARMVVSGDPTFNRAYVDAGWLLWSMDRDAEAIELYEQGMAANPDSAACANELGFLYLRRKKDFKRAAEAFERAVKCADCPSIVRHSLAHAYERAGQLDKAYAEWERAAGDSKNPGRAAAKVNLERLRRRMPSKN